MKTNNTRQDILNSLKDQYQNIPVPEEAKARLLEGIHQAKAEMEGQSEPAAENTLHPDSLILRQTRKAKVRMMLKRTGAAAAAAVAVITILANSSPTVAMAMENIPVIGAIAQVVTFRTYQSQEGKFQANVEIPEISSPDESSENIAETPVFCFRAEKLCNLTKKSSKSPTYLYKYNFIDSCILKEAML